MSDHAFWQYSLDRYGRKGVPEICLSLQDERGADVNLVLFALWLAQEGRSLGPDDAEKCVAAVRDWHGSVVVPMRGVRRWLKDREVEDTAARDRLRDAIKTNFYSPLFSEQNHYIKSLNDDMKFRNP